MTEVNPGSNYVLTARNGKVTYDFLVLVPGCQMDFSLVQGISREELGKGNVHCIYDYKGAIACRDALRKLPALRSGRLVFANTYTKMKCGGAPKKICLMTEDYLRQRHLRDNFQIEFYGNQDELMKPKVYGDRLATIFAERKIQVKFCRQQFKSGIIVGTKADWGN